jgi:hypothetical protein
MEQSDDFPAEYRVRDDNTDRITGVAFSSKIRRSEIRSHHHRKSAGASRGGDSPRVTAERRSERPGPAGSVP